MTKQSWDRIDDLTQSLFRHALDAGMKLTFDDLNALRQALKKKFGLGGWHDLYRICQRLWVKPCSNLSEDHLQIAFKRLRQNYQPELNSSIPKFLNLDKRPTFVPDILPQIPQRSLLKSPSQEDGDQPGAVRVRSRSQPKRASRSDKSYSVWPVHYPLSEQDYRTIWRYLKQALMQTSPELTLDLDASVERIGLEGIGTDLVLKPILSRNLELLLIIDDSFSMRPYREAIAPLCSELKDKKIDPHAIYRMDGYPDQMLAPWEHSIKAVPIEILLTRWSAKRTVVIIFSDAGAAKGSASQQRVEKTAIFLERLHSNVRQVLWLNPLPMKRWRETPAQAIAKILNGAMVPVGPIVLEMSRSISHQEWFVEV